MRRLDVHRWLAAVLFASVAVAACATSDANEDALGSAPETSTTSFLTDTPMPESHHDARRLLSEAGRVDLDPTGNRVLTGAGSLLGSEPVDVSLDSEPRWIVPTGPSSWLVVLEDGSTVVIDVDDDGAASVAPTTTGLDADATQRPPLALPDGVAGFDEFHGLFGDPLPDTRVVVADHALVALGGPTDRYAHGVLGDALEASTIEVATSSSGPTVLVELDEPDVFEAVSPMIADVDDDGTDEVVTTVSNSTTGARLVAYSLVDGSIVAEAEPIGLGNRWRNLLAVAPVGPNGEVEIVDVRTPHIGGIVEFFRVDGDRMELVASTQAFSTHSIGSRNLDLGIISDADGDGRLDVIVPNQELSQLAVLVRDDVADGGVNVRGRVDLGGTLTTNVAADESAGGVRYAVGIDDGTVLIWP